MPEVFHPALFAGALIAVVIAMWAVNVVINKTIRDQVKQLTRLLERTEETLAKWVKVARVQQGQMLSKHAQWSAKNMRLRTALQKQQAMSQREYDRAEGYRALLLELVPEALNSEELIDATDESPLEPMDGPVMVGELGSLTNIQFIHPENDQFTALKGDSPIVGANGESLPGPDLRGRRAESELWIGGRRVD